MMEKIGILKLITLYKYTDKPAISRAVLRYRLDMYQCLKNRISMKYKKILKLNNGLISDVLLKFMTKIYSVDIYSKILKESDFVDESICTFFVLYIYVGFVTIVPNKHQRISKISNVNLICNLRS